MASVPLGQAAAVLRAELAQRRLDPDRLSLFEAWAAFKAFARTPVVADDEECVVEFFAAFVAAVEGSAPFQDAAARQAEGSLVYENEA